MAAIFTTTLALVASTSGCRARDHGALGSRSDATAKEAVSLLWGGCSVVRAVEPGRLRCDLGPDRTLTLWWPGPANVDWRLGTDAGVVEVREKVPVQEGTRAVVVLPARARVLTAEAKTGETLWALPLGEVAPRPEIEALLAAGKAGESARAIARLSEIVAHGPEELRGPAAAALGRVYLVLDQVDSAIPALRRAIEAGRAEGRLSDVVRDGTVLIWALTELRQRFGEARQELASLSTAARRFPEGEACAAYSEGGIGSLSGDLRTALASYRLAVRLGERLGLLHLMNQAAEDLGRIYTAIGRADEAVATLQDLPLADDPCARATSALNRAEAFMAAASAHARTDSDGPAHGARAREAIVFARRATGFCGDPHRRVLATTYALDDALERGDREAADEAASALLAKGEHPDALASVWRDDAVGRWLLARGRAAEALASFDEARALARSAGIEEEVVRAEVGAGRALLVLGRRRRAVTRFRMAAQELRGALAGIPVAEGRGEFLRGHDEAFRYLVEALVNEGTPREAWNVARAARRAEFVSLARAQRLGLLSPAARQAWEQAIERYARLRHVLELESADDWKLSRGELARIRAGRQVRAEQARQALDEAYRILGGAEVAGDRPEEPTPEGQVELLFFPGPREGASWFVFTRVGASVRVRTVPASGLANNEAASRVLVVMSPELARARRLRLLTYDLADRIDWQSVSWRGAKLSKTLEVTYGLDLQAEGRTASVGAGNIVLVGDPTGDLPGAREEAEMLAEKLARGRLLRLDGGAATRDAVLSALAGASLFHYAGHAESLGPSGMSSALLTAGGSRIELGDLLAAPRVPAGVVLSACEAAASTPRSLMGIAQGFLIAGAEAVIAAPRAVKDVSARTFMVNLYAHLTNADVPALEKAYREALLTADQTDAQMFRLVVQ